MSDHKSSRLTAMRARIKRVWSELDYVSRRMLDVRVDEQRMQDAREKDPGAHAARRAPTPAQ